MTIMKRTRFPLPTPRRRTFPKGIQSPAKATWADLLIALAVTALTMCLLNLIAAFIGENVAGDEAGRFWALLFAGGLGFSGLFLFLLGLVGLGENARMGSHYIVPVAIGITTGLLVAALLLDGADRKSVLTALLVLLIATPPIREGFSWLLKRRPRRGSQ